MDSYSVNTIVRGYHVYKDVWEATHRQLLPCQREPGNIHNPYAVAVVDRGVPEVQIIGHVPRAISSVCYFFLRKGGSITCRVTGSRQRSVDLPQGGLEIPCELTFSGGNQVIVKVRKLLQEAYVAGLLTSFSKEKILQQDDRTAKQPEKKRRIEKSNDETVTWVQHDGIVLTEHDKAQLSDGEWLNDKHINYAQSLLKQQFPKISGFKSTLLLHKKQEKITNGMQIVHTQGNHWIVASTLGCNGTTVKIYDSLYESLDKKTQTLVLNVFETIGEPHFEMMEMDKQKGASDCGLYAIAVATSLAFGSQLKFKIHLMRDHLLNCFNSGKMSPFH